MRQISANFTSYKCQPIPVDRKQTAPIKAEMSCSTQKMNYPSSSHLQAYHPSFNGLNRSELRKLIPRGGLRPQGIIASTFGKTKDLNREQVTQIAHEVTNIVKELFDPDEPFSIKDLNVILKRAFPNRSITIEKMNAEDLNNYFAGCSTQKTRAKIVINPARIKPDTFFKFLNDFEHELTHALNFTQNSNVRNVRKKALRTGGNTLDDLFASFEQKIALMLKQSSMDKIRIINSLGDNEVLKLSHKSSIDELKKTIADLLNETFEERGLFFNLARKDQSLARLDFIQSYAEDEQAAYTNGENSLAPEVSSIIRRELQERGLKPNDITAEKLSELKAESSERQQRTSFDEVLACLENFEESGDAIRSLLSYDDFQLTLKSQLIPRFYELMAEVAKRKRKDLI